MKEATDKTDYTQATDSGKLYITTEDFFKQEEIRSTIKELLHSKLIEQINNAKAVDDSKVAIMK